MPISNIIFYTEKGRQLLAREYRADVSKHAVEAFRTRVIVAKKFGKPIVSFGQTSFMYHRDGDVFVVAASRENVNTAMVFQFLYNLVTVLKAYFKKFDVESLENNFVLIFELLDEIMDNGFPQITAPNVLQRWITSGNKLDAKSKGGSRKVIDEVTGRVDWRERGIVKAKNEVYIDVLEAINLLKSATGEELRKDVSGVIQMKANLSGMPECKFGMNDKLMLESERKKPSKARKSRRKTQGIAIDDVQFHRCVQLHAFELDRTINFVPPDGDFELMRYRVTNRVNLPFRITHTINETPTKVSYVVNIMADFSVKTTAKDVILKIPTPTNAAKPRIKVLNGKAKYNPSQHAIFWKMKKFPGGARQEITASCNRLKGLKTEVWSRPPITIDFQVGMAASGLAIRFLKVLEPEMNYDTIKWVRYMTRAGQYQLRI